ncbi:MAG: SelT/SelW/SelH family protein [Caldilineaceae bacterium]
MAVTKERFEQGLTYDAYKEQMTRNRDRLDATEESVTFAPADLAFFNQLPATLNVLALAEDWCGDVIANLPILGRLAAACDTLDLRIFLRDQNLDIMDQYLKNGEFRSIPVFVFFDENFNELGYWIERPAKMTELQAEMRRNLFATDPLLADVAPDTPMGQLPEEARNRVMQAFGEFRQEKRDFSNSEVVREIRELLTKGGVQPVATNGAAAPRATNGATPVTKQSQAKVSITYCAACGYEPQTLELTSALMHTFVQDLALIELIPWHEGAFDVVVNGDLIHSMYRDGGFPETETILNAVRERIG